MIPILFDANATTFNTMGLGALSDAITCRTKEGLDCSYELEMEYPVSGNRYKLLTLDKIIFAKANFADRPQPFRIYSITKPMNGKVKYYAQHISYDLSGYPVGTYRADNVEDALAGLSEYSIGDMPFTFSTNMDGAEHEGEFLLAVPSTIRPTLGGYSDSIQTIYGGEFQFDQFEVKLLSSRGENRGVTVYYGKNLIDLNQEESCTQVYTGVLPYWTYTFADGTVQTLALSEPVIELPGEHPYRKIYMLDLTQDFTEEEAAFSEYQETRLALSQAIVDQDDVSINKLQNLLSTKQDELTAIRQNPNHTTAQVEAKQKEIEQVRKDITTAQDKRTEHQTTRNDVQDEIYETPYVPNTEYVKTSKLPYPYVDTTKSQNGITWTDNGDGTITATGKATADTDFVLTSTVSSSTIETEGKQYIIKTGVSGTSDESVYVGGFVGNSDSDGKDFSDICVEGTTAYNGCYKIKTTGYSKFGRIFIRIKKDVELDNITFSPEVAYWTITDRGENLLREHAEAFIEENDLVTPAVNLTLDFYQLSTLKDRVDLGDTVSVYFERLGVSATARCIKYTWNVLEDRYESIELGSAQTTFAETMSNTTQAVQQSNETAQAIQEEVQRTLGKADQNRLLVEQAQKSANSAIANADAAAAATDNAIVLADSASLEAADAKDNAEAAQSAASDAQSAASAAQASAAAVAANVAEQEARLQVAEDEIDDHARDIVALQSVVGDTGEWESDETIAKIFKEQQTAIQQNAHDIRTSASSVTVTKLDASQVASDLAAANGNVTEAQEALAQTVAAADDATVNAAAAEGYAEQARTEATTARSKANDAYQDYLDAQAALQDLIDHGGTPEEIAEAEAAVETANAAYTAANDSATAAEAEATRAEGVAFEASQIATRATAQIETARQAVVDAQAAADAAAADQASLRNRLTAAETAITQNSDAIALRATKQELTILDDNKNKVFTGETTPTDPKVGDLWFKSASEPIYTCIDQNGSLVWVELNKYTDDTTVNEVAADLANNYYTKVQTDAALTVEADRITQSVSSTYATITSLNDLSSTVDDTIDLANAKGRVFTTTPRPPYDIGDLWVQGSTGDIFKCKIARAATESYHSTDWDKASKYTDDTVANAVGNNLTTNYYTKVQTNAQITTAVDGIRSEVTEQIEAIQVGGTNLLRESRKMPASGSDYTIRYYAGSSSGYTFTFADSTDGDFREAKISLSGLTAQIWPYVSTSQVPRAKFESAKKLTFSFEIKVDNLSNWDNRPGSTAASNVLVRIVCKDSAHASMNLLGVRYISTYLPKASVLKAGTWYRVHITSPELWQDTGWFSDGDGTWPDVEYVSAGVYASYNGSIHIRKFKLEEGELNTDWSPAPEDHKTYVENNYSTITQTADQIATAVSSTKSYTDNAIGSITVGGRNLLRRSASRTFSLWSTAQDDGATMTVVSGETVDEWGCTDAFHVYGRAGATTQTLVGVLGGVYTTSNASIDGEKYVFSMFVKNNGSTNSVAIGFNGLGASITVKPGESKRVVQTGTGNGAHNLQFVLYASAVNAAYNITCWHPQIEYGSTVTDWSPAPEDLEADYNSKFNTVEQNISSLTQTAASISSEVSKKVNTTTYNTNNQAVSQQISSLSSRIDQTAGSIRGIVSEEISGLEDQAESISNWFDFSVSNFLTIGQSGSAYKTQITNSAFNILHGSSVIGSFSNSGLDTSAITLSSSLSLPPFTLESINNGTEWLLTE